MTVKALVDDFQAGAAERVVVVEPGLRGGLAGAMRLGLLRDQSALVVLSLQLPSASRVRSIRPWAGQAEPEVPQRIHATAESGNRVP